MLFVLDQVLLHLWFKDIAFSEKKKKAIYSAGNSNCNFNNRWRANRTQNGTARSRWSGKSGLNFIGLASDRGNVFIQTPVLEAVLT